MTILDNAKSHFKDLIAGNGIKCIEVAEWGDKDAPAKVYFKPLAALPVQQFSEVAKLATQESVEAFIDILIIRCLDENGAPLFKKTNRLELLRHVSPQVVCSVITQMGEIDNSLEEMGDLEKKSN